MMHLILLSSVGRGPPPVGLGTPHNDDLAPLRKKVSWSVLELGLTRRGSLAAAFFTAPGWESKAGTGTSAGTGTGTGIAMDGRQAQWIRKAAQVNGVMKGVVRK